MYMYVYACIYVCIYTCICLSLYHSFYLYLLTQYSYFLVHSLHFLFSLWGQECDRVATPEVAMSDETWKMSFGKFLEISFYNMTAKGRTNGCTHNIRLMNFSYYLDLFSFCSFPHNTIVYYTILYYTILYYTILYYTILYYTILYYTILYYTILYYTILYNTILYYTILYYTIQYIYTIQLTFIFHYNIGTAMFYISLVTV